MTFSAQVKHQFPIQNRKKNIIIMNFYKPQQQQLKVSKRKSLPTKSFPRGYKDGTPGVTIQIGFGSLGGFVIRSLSATSSSSSCSDSGSLPSSPKPAVRYDQGIEIKGIRKRTQRKSSPFGAKSRPRRG